MNNPLVLFGRYGSNSHCSRADDSGYRLFVAENGERRARKTSGRQLPYSSRKTNEKSRNIETSGSEGSVAGGRQDDGENEQ